MGLFGVFACLFIFLWVALFCYIHQCHLTTISYLAAAVLEAVDSGFQVFFIFPRMSFMKLPEKSATAPQAYILSFEVESLSSALAHSESSENSPGLQQRSTTRSSGLFQDAWHPSPHMENERESRTVGVSPARTARTDPHFRPSPATRLTARDAGNCSPAVAFVACLAVTTPVSSQYLDVTFNKLE